MIKLMPYQFLQDNFLYILLGLFTLVFLTLYLREFYLRKKLGQFENKLLEEEQQKSYEIIHEAVKKSQDIIGMAELQGVKIAADSKFAADKYVQTYAQKLDAEIKESHQTLVKTTTAATTALNSSQQEYLKYLEELRQRSDTIEFTSAEAARQRINQLFERFERRLTDFLVQTEQSSTQAIDLELKSARQLIDAYKTQQLKMVDENIMSMLERTLSIVLNKKLPLKDQMDLIYEALEKAKIEKFIV